MIDLFDLKTRKQGLAKRRDRMLEARRRDLGAGASLVLQHGDPRIKSGSSLPQVTIYRLTVHETDVVTLTLLKDLDEQIAAMSNEIERAALSAMQTTHEPRSSKLIPTALAESSARIRNGQMCGVSRLPRNVRPSIRRGAQTRALA